MVQKIISVLIIIFLFAVSSVKSEEIDNGWYYFNAYKHPTYYQYFDDYMNILGNEFEKIKFFRKYWQVKLDYEIHSDGTVQNLTIDKNSSDLINRKKIKKLVENTQPLKFYDGMDKDYLNINIYFGVNKFTEEYSIWYTKYCPYKDDGCFSIHMYRKI